jgi:hypothetical protein
MNFKTTIALIVLLAAAGAALYFTREKPNAGETAEVNTDSVGKLIPIDSKDVTSVIITPADGSQLTLKKVGTDWEVTEPVTAPADTFEVDSLVRSFTDAKSRGEIDPGGENAAATGLAKPRYQVQLVTPAKTVKLAIGDKSAVGDNLYVQLDGNSKADLIDATDLGDKLDKGADTYRKKELVSAAADQITQITVTRPSGKLALAKTGSDWQFTEPTTMPADSSAASDLTYAITGLRADSFVEPKHVPPMALVRPQMTVSFAAQKPAVAPATQPSAPVMTTIEFGSYDDILKKNVYATIVGSNSVALLPATAMDGFKKTPLELRDKKVVNIDPEQVSKLTLATDRASTTQPTTRPASNMTVTLERRKVDHTLGPVLSAAITKTATRPTTVPATAPATEPVLAATTKPAEPLSQWVLDGTATAADDAKVTKLLGDLHPLTADKFREVMPTTRPIDTYVLTITTTGPGGTPVVEHVLTLIDPGNDQPLLGTYDGLSFETSRTIVPDLAVDFKK